MQMNYKIAGQFEHLYPVTLGDNVKLNSGKTLEEWKVEIDDLLNAVEDSGYKEIWSGNHILGVTGSGITMPQSLGSARTGWVLLFEMGSSNSNKNYCYIPKIHPTGGYSVKFLIGGTGGAVYSKYLIINGASIEGHSSNNTGGNELMALKKVYSY